MTHRGDVSRVATLTTRKQQAKDRISAINSEMVDNANAMQKYRGQIASIDQDIRTVTPSVPKLDPEIQTPKFPPFKEPTLLSVRLSPKQNGDDFKYYDTRFSNGKTVWASLSEKELDAARACVGLKPDKIRERCYKVYAVMP